MKMTDTAIKIEKLTRRYGTLTAVDKLDLEIPPGIVFGFLGPNGAGKTTTIRLLLGLSHPNGGKASILGRDPVSEGGRLRELCGALLENPGLYERISALDNLKYFAEIYHLPSPKKDQRIEELLRRVDLWERRRDKVKEWSRGMKQKLALCRAMLHEPRVLFLDEPTLGLDVATSRKIRRTIRDMAEKKGCTVFYTSHNLDEVERLCDQAAIIREGRLLAKGSPDELKARRGGRKIHIRGEAFTEVLCAALRKSDAVRELSCEDSDGGGKGIALTLNCSEKLALNDVLKTIIDSGGLIQRVEEEPRSLETAFLELTEDNAASDSEAEES